MEIRWRWHERETSDTGKALGPHSSTAQLPWGPVRVLAPYAASSQALQ